MQECSSRRFVDSSIASSPRAAATVGMLFLGLFLTACESSLVPHSAIVGKWKSNAPLTLRSLADTKGMAPQSRAILENNFFGHLETEIGESASRTIDQRDQYDSGDEPYEVLEISDGYIRIKAWSNFFQDYGERTLYLEGDCYYEVFKQFEFRQYFCRVPD